jgi:3-oxoadipate enol-lactonase
MGVGTLLHAVARHPERFRRLALVTPPTAGAARAAQADGYRELAELAEKQGRGHFAAAMAAAPPLPLLAAGGWTSSPADVDSANLPAVLRGAAATDLPSAAIMAAIEQPVLLLPWIDDPSHPVAAAERLHKVLPHSILHVVRTPDDLRVLGEAIARHLDG